MAEANLIELGDDNALMAMLQAVIKSGRWREERDRTITIVLTEKFSSDEDYNSAWLAKHLTSIIQKIEVIN